MRSATVTRETHETDVTVTVNLDGTGKTSINTGIGFLDHMLTLSAFHGKLDLAVNCRGDLEVDSHHTIEDIGLTFGQAVRESIGENPAIVRYGLAYVPMDEALSRCVVDVSGRPYIVFNSTLPIPYIGEMETEMVKEFFRAVAQEARITVHMETLYGDNTHHIIESLFKSFGRALGAAVAPAGEGVASTKGKI